jgi:asparagine synthase (glutamine-hydrolysing)
MCGVAGILDWRGGDYAPRRELLTAMIEQLQHRGPDGYGYLTKPHIGLAHSRLSIIDLSGGDQPIHNEDKSVWVIFNGEIFNYVELRAELEAQGHSFYTHSDTEVIVHLYEQYGDDFVHYLNGQFAIALWDERCERLLLIRDRVGIAPLFYTKQGPQLLFASEIKAILPALHESPCLNANALNQIMTFWMPVSPNTLFENIFELPPGMILIADRSGEQLRRYWDWEYPQSADEYHRGSEDDLATELRELLVAATQIRLRADVPVGAYLSGGLDSSVLTSLIHNHSDAPLRTFSIGFDEESLDESAYQRLMIEHLNAQHSNIACSNQMVGDEFVDTIRHAETAILRTAPVPMKLLSGLVHQQGYKVVLTGEGSDEVLGGYDLFKENKIRQFWAKQPQSQWRPLLLKRLYPYLDLTPGRAQSYLQNFYGIGLDKPDAFGFSHLPRWDTTSKAKMFFADALQQRIDGIAEVAMAATVPSEFSRWHPLNRAQYIEAKALMGGYLLCSQGDRMLMTNSVEGRFPFLDHRVIEFGNKLPPKMKIKGLNEKYLLKKAMRSYLPPAIVDRHKQPYRAPDVPAFFFAEKNGDGTKHVPLPFVAELLSPQKIRDYGYFDAKRVEMLVKKAERGLAVGYRDNQALVGILSTQVWHHLFIENFSKFRF